jgi:hypothetical protein
VTEEVRKMMLSIFLRMEHYRPMKEHHICFSAKGDQWEKSFLISGDRGGAEDDAEHIREHLNYIDQWKSTTSVLAPMATNERRAFSFQVTEEVRKMMLSIFASIEDCRPMRKHHLSFSPKGDQWEKSFLISGDRGGAEDDAEHIRKHWTMSTNERAPHLC